MTAHAISEMIANGLDEDAPLLVGARRKPWVVPRVQC
jgi:hypothetical protein